MRHLLFFIIFGGIFLPLGASAFVMAKAQPVPKSAEVIASTNNIPTAYSSAAGSKLVTGMNSLYYSHVMIFNETTSRIAWTSAGPNTTPSSSSIYGYCPGSTFCAWDDIKIFDSRYIQSDTGSSIRTGTVEINVW